MSVLDGLRSRIDWKKVINEILDIVAKSAGSILLLLLSPYIITNSPSYIQSILSGDILQILVLVILTPLMLWFCRWWNTRYHLISKSLEYNAIKIVKELRGDVAVEEG